MYYETDSFLTCPVGKRPIRQAYRLVQPLRRLLRSSEMEDAPKARGAQQSCHESRRVTRSSLDRELEGYLTLSPPPRSRL
jgi:hypothetical protein